MERCVTKSSEVSDGVWYSRSDKVDRGRKGVRKMPECWHWPKEESAREDRFVSPFMLPGRLLWYGRVVSGKGLSVDRF